MEIITNSMLIASLASLLTIVSTLNIDPNDLLSGKGLFLTPDLSSFDIHSSHLTSFLSPNATNILRLEKPTGVEVNFRDGLVYYFENSSPQHIQFKFASTNPDTEDSNFRICDSEGESVVLFRAGKGGLIRVNEKQMISFYNDSVSTDSEIKMTQIDLKLNWTQKRINVFVNGEYKQNCEFFNTSVSQVNKLLLYNLYNSVSYWQDIVICSDMCYDFVCEPFIKFSFAILGLLYILVH